MKKREQEKLELKLIFLSSFSFSNLKKRSNFMLHDYKIEVNNSNDLKNNTMLNCSMELSVLNNLFRENLITQAERIEIKRKILKDYKLL